LKKETLYIVIGVTSVVLVGATAVWILSRKHNNVVDNLLEKLSDENRKRVMTLHPNARLKFAEFISKVQEKGYLVVITSGYRDFEKQAQLHKENSNNAKAGYSNHNYGYAIDINILDPKTGDTLLRKASSVADWEKSGIVAIAKKLGLEWGGDFKNYHDPIHFQMPREKTTAQMLALVNDGKVDKDGYVLAFSGTKKTTDFELERPSKRRA
jgi:peptidoglycan L-alanyl-D-glutamate endopeptidase CwlK